MKLNAKSIEAIKPTDRRVEYPDHLVKGLRLIVQPTGIKTYQLRYRYNGQGKRLSLGRVDRGATLADVRDQARDALLKVENGIDPSHQAKQVKEENISIDFQI